MIVCLKYLSAAKTMVTVHKYRTKMIVYNKLLSILSLLLCGLFLIAACENAEENKARHLRQGKKYFGEENYDKARVELKNVLQVDPKSAEAYNLLGQIEEYNKNWRKAIAHYYQAIELAPDLLGPKIRLGRFYIQQASIAKKLNNTNTEDKYIKYAKKKVDAAIQIDPLHTDTLVLKASLLAYQGSDDEAIRILQKVLEINPKSIDSVLLLSRIYVHKNLNKEAEKLLKKGIIASPEKVDTYVELAKLGIEPSAPPTESAVGNNVVATLPHQPEII